MSNYQKYFANFLYLKIYKKKWLILYWEMETVKYFV